MELVGTLAKLGLTKKEAEVYLTLLSLGKTTGYQVAKKSKLDRSTTYFLLRELRKKGLVLQVPCATRQYFLAKDPQTFITEKKQDVFSAESILPQLLQMTQVHEGPQTLHFEGYEGSRESLVYMLEHANTDSLVAFCSYTPGGPSQEVVNSVLTTVQEMDQRGIRVRAIVPDVEEVPLYFLPHMQKGGWDFRLMPVEHYDLRSSFFVIDRFVRILSRSRGMGVVIENDELADMARHVFESVWNIAKKNKKLQKA